MVEHTTENRGVGGSTPPLGTRADVAGLVAEHRPGYRVESVVLLGQGLDNVAYLVNDELIVRFSKVADAAERAERVRREAGVLALVAGISPLVVPAPRFVDFEHGCLAYSKVPGVPVGDLPRAARLALAGSIGARLGAFLGAVHALPVDRMARLVELDDDHPVEWLREAAESYRTVAVQIPRGYRAAVEAFLSARPPKDGYPRVFSHNDLGSEHVLVEASTGCVTGIIDWSDAAIDDPAYDFGLVLRDLGPLGLDAALSSYRRCGSVLEKLRQRAVFYARCSVFEDVAYGIAAQRDSYIQNAIGALEWLFAASSRR